MLLWAYRMLFNFFCVLSLGVKPQSHFVCRGFKPEEGSVLRGLS